MQKYNFNLEFFDKPVMILNVLMGSDRDKVKELTKLNN